MPRDTGPFLAANLAALSARDPALAASVRASSPDPALSVLTAKDGSPVPAVHDGERPLPLHSLYDPVRESRRLFDATPPGTDRDSARPRAGCIVFFGLGAGYQVSAALEDPSVCAVIVVERSVATIRALFQKLPLSPILGDPRVRLVAGAGGVKEAVLATWQPALVGALRTVPLVPWCGLDRDLYASLSRETESAIEAARADYGVQAHFGTRWFSNMLKNMPAAERQGREVPRRSRASVTAAGPSLEAQLGAVRGARRGGILLATDTSLPALLASGISPDAVLSIDCQNYGYHHFLGGLPPETTLFLDLASPPLLARRAPRTWFVASGHPFASWLRARWMEIPRIDMSGGNVTHAAVSLARGLGARHITLYGADYSYPRGAAYCRGTYLHHYFQARQDRVSPVESRFFSFLFRDPRTTGENTETGRRYTTPLLTGYRDRLIEQLDRLDADCIAAPGDGLPVLQQRTSRPSSAPLHWFPPRCGWKDVLEALADELDGLPSLGVGGRWAALSSMTPPQRDLWSVLLPIAARTASATGGRVQTPGDAPAVATALEEARAWAVGRVRRALSPRLPESAPLRGSMP
jgi:hypothetical protein